MITAGIGASRFLKSPYLSRKVIHMFVGIAGLFVPFVFSALIVPLLISIIYSLLIIVLKVRGMIRWIEMEGSAGEVYFAVMLPLLLGTTWNFDIWLGVTVLSYMAFGDGVTGVMRWAFHGERGKWLEGSIAMLAVSTITGGAIYGYAHGMAGLVMGVVGGVAATFAERIEVIDDNVSIPAIALPIMLITRQFLGQI